MTVTEDKQSDPLGLSSYLTHEMFGFPVIAATLDEILALSERAIAKRVRLNFGQLSGPTLVRIQRDHKLRRSYLAADIFFADGAGVVVASKILGCPLPERVTGIDLMFRLMEQADKKAYKVYLLGAEQSVLDKVYETFSRDYPGAQIVGRRNGFFKDEEEPEIAEMIRESGADMLFVAITTPKKENFLARWQDMMGVPVLHGVGGSFDVVAGKVQRAPGVWQKLNLEWAYRIVQEPKRMWRREGMANVLFAGMLAWELAARVLKPEGA
jgi:N-acetylglucosaminyldiphosphoundecaprenol N-acetyl-beta-D-mannosaminyltransferase